MKRPTFFLSSTIFDFADLRGAIKFHLEERGCEVLASEFNDFRKPLDRHSYEACLEALGQADYFILLIGTRVGGWFDEAARVSITQQEYREAYRLHLAGRLKILTLVRREVWTFRQNHRGLEAHLRSLPLDPVTAAQIKAYPSKFADDAEFTLGFLDEVGRLGETKAAARSGAPFPTANWIHPFGDFREVVDVLNVLTVGALPADQAAFRRALRSELLDLLGKSLVKQDAGVVAPRLLVDRFDAEFRLQDFHRRLERIPIPTKAWNSLTGALVQLVSVDFRTYLLQQALASPTFLEFDLESDGYIETPPFRALQQLDRLIRSARAAMAGPALSATFASIPEARRTRATTVDVEFQTAAAVIALAYAWANIADLLSALIAHLDGAPFEPPSLAPLSPVSGADADLEARRVSEAEASSYVRTLRGPSSV